MVNVAQQRWKLCYKGKHLKPLIAFNKHSSSNDGYASSCRDCINEERRNKNNPKRTIGSKKCSRCKEMIPYSEFTACKSNPDGCDYECKICKAEKWEGYVSSRDGFLNELFRNVEGNAKAGGRVCEIKLADINELIDKQRGKCALTGVEMTYGRDSDHILNIYNVSVDRIDSNRGYTRDNIQLISVMANKAKSNLPLDHLFSLFSMIAHHTRDLVIQPQLPSDLRPLILSPGPDENPTQGSPTQQPPTSDIIQPLTLTMGVSPKLIIVQA